jgi:hypothetical protein
VGAKELTCFPVCHELDQACVHLDDVTDAFAVLIDKRRELPKELMLFIGA